MHKNSGGNPRNSEQQSQRDEDDLIWLLQAIAGSVAAAMIVMGVGYLILEYL